MDHSGKALCPFHHDNNPSLQVTEKKGIAYCFSCKEGGNAISFVKKYEEQVNHNHISNNEALIKVVEICGLDIDVSKLKKNKEDYQFVTSSKKYTDNEKKLLEANKYLANLFHYLLTVPTELTKEGNIPLDYLHNRGISDEIIKEMNLGVAYKGQLLKFHNKDENAIINDDILKQLGMIKYKDTGYYEVFEDRIMFPITDEKGNVTTFAGRTIKDGEGSKYLHTTETPIFQKRELLYNYSNAKNYSYNDELIMVEGYMDVIGAKKKGFDNVVALMGTAITEEHMNLLKKNHCSITLALDNDYTKEDNTGKNAMIKVIPNLLKEGFKVDVIDISKLGEFKDFGDLGNTELSKADILEAKVSSFTFIMDNYYFKDKELNVQNIHEVFELAKKDSFIKTTLDESKFKEYIFNRTSFDKEALDEILYPKSLKQEETPLSSFQNVAIHNYLVQSINSYVGTKNDKILSSFYNLNKEKLEKVAIEVFDTYDTRYLSNDKQLNVALLLDDILKLDNNYSNYVALNSFTYNNVFDKSYIKNRNGSAKVNLNFEQKQMIIKQFEDSLSDDDKLAMEEVEELYIINDTTDLDGILYENNETMQMFKSNIQERMFLNKNKMEFFKYGNLFLKIDKEFISNDYKGKTGNFKTILFFNNLTGQMKIERDQLIKENAISEIVESEKIVEEDTKDYVFSINKCIFVDSLATDTHYFVRVPNTSAQDYIYLPKSEGNWTNDGEMFFTKLKSGERYKIYDRLGNFKREISMSQLKHYWEDKTNHQVIENKSKDESNKKIIKVPITKSEEAFAPSKNAVCKIFKTRILEETDNGYYVKTNDPEKILFVSKKICEWNINNVYLRAKPKKNLLTGSGISRYSYDGKNRTFDKRLSLEEIEEYLNIFYPSSYTKKFKEVIKVEKTKCEHIENFIKIPITLDNVYGFVKISAYKCREDGKHIILELSKNEQLYFYSKDDNYIGNYNALEIKDALNQKEKIIPFPQKNAINFEELMNSYSNSVYEIGEDKLEFQTDTIESGYEFFETVTTVKLNGNYLYKPEAINVAPYKNEIVQKGMFRKKEEVVDFLQNRFGNKDLQLCNDSIEREVVA